MRSEIRRLALTVAVVVVAGWVPSTATARPHDGSGPYRFDGRAVNGAFHARPTPDHWLAAATTNGHDLVVSMASELGARIAEGWMTFTCGSGPCVAVTGVYAFRGRFSQTSQDDACTYHRLLSTGSAVVVCWYRYGSTLYATHPAESATTFTADMPTSSGVGTTGRPEGFAVGDFDGDGYDEILTYNSWTGVNARVWRYNRSTQRFELSATQPENLTDLNWAGGIRIFAANIRDADGFVGLDDLIVYNRTARQFRSYETRRPRGGYPRFWSWGGTNDYPILAADEEPTVARYDNDAFDDLVFGTYTGAASGSIQSYSAEPPARSIASISQGNIPYGSSLGEAHLIWGNLQDHDPGRDDVFQVRLAENRYYAYDAHPWTYYVWFDAALSGLRASLYL